MPQLSLHQFPISHYCEKIRWVLDFKGLRYELKNQLPGPHMLVNKKLVGRATVPVLIDGHHAVGNSSAIALYLDDQFPDRKVIPSDPVERAEVLALEAYFDETAGVSSRRFIYSYVLRDVTLFRRVFFEGYGMAARVAGSLLAGVVVKQIRKMYRVGDVGIAESSRAIEQAAQRIEELTGGNPRRYLFGDRLSLADITAASLLGPMVSPPGSPWTMDIDVPELVAARESLRKRPAGQWILARYAEDRRFTHAPSIESQAD